MRVSRSGASAHLGACGTAAAKGAHRLGALLTPAEICCCNAAADRRHRQPCASALSIVQRWRCTDART